MWQDPPEQFERRRDENKLKRIQKDSDIEEEGKVQKWLDLAKRLFDKDKDPDTKPA